VNLNLVDLFLIVVILAAMAYGWRTGILRQLVTVSALMFAFIAASQLYRPLAAWLSAIPQLPTPNYFEGLSYLLILLFAAAVWFLGIHRLYPYTRLFDPDGGGAPVLFDNLGGMLIGALLGLLLVVAIVGVVELLVYYAWPHFIPGGPRDVIHVSVSNAGLVQWLVTERPELAEYLGDWVPGLEVAREGRILS
jgi:membrane protein required for colicin V production